jgi:hypothetical protein
MAHILNLPHPSWLTLDRINAAVRKVPHAVAAEHELALRAASKAAMHRRCLTELQAMYVGSARIGEGPGADQMD